ncbi:MAG: hypothetical protein R6X02_24780 [Enhygromyxa sp.]
MHPVAELSKVAGEFRHLQAEHSREGPAGSWRRRQRSQMEELEQSFDTLLQRWVPDADEQARWRDHFYRGAEQPGELPRQEPPVFRGRAEDGSALVIQANKGALELSVDGASVDRWPLERTIDVPVHLGDAIYHEVFDVPPAALEALMNFIERRTSAPPWSWARALFDEGMIDANFSLTTRGRRFRDSQR